MNDKTIPHPQLGMKWRRLIHRPLITVARASLKHNVCLLRNDFIPNGRPTIYAFTHVFKDDIASVLCCLRDNTYVLNNVAARRTFAGVSLWLNGVIWIDRSCKTSRGIAKEKMIAALNTGCDILLAPEAAWNLSPNLLVQKLWWGLLDIALSADANIVPVAVDLVGDDYCVIIGETFNQSEYADKTGAITALRDTMAAMVWELLEMKPKVSREDSSMEQWLSRIHDEFKRTPFLNLATEESAIFRSKGEISLGELLADLHGIEYRSMVADYGQYKRIERLIELWSR